MDPENVYWLGTISKTRGVSGSVVLILYNEVSEKFYDLESVFLEIEGHLVPFFIHAADPFGQNSILLNFDSVKTENQGKKLTGCKVFTGFSDIIITELKGFQYSYLKGYTVHDHKYGKIGKITEILLYPDNPVFQIKQDQKTVLVPIHEDLILEIDSHKKLVYIKTPEGLLDLFE